MKRALFLLLSGCVTATAPAVIPAPAPAPAVVAAAPPPAVDAGPAPWTEPQVQAHLALDCQACHSLSYVRQQRLTEAQWAGTLTKMRGWGAMLPEEEVAPLARALAQRHGPGSPLAPFPVQEVALFSAAAPPPGDATRGKVLFDTRCFACHGPGARGSIGVNLGDRPLLQQPGAFAAFVKTGRGRMPAQPDLNDAQLGDLLAWLRTQ